MRKKTFLKLLKDPEVEMALGNIMMRAIQLSLLREIEIESGKDNPGGPPIIKTERWNVLDFIVKYIPFLEGGMRGAQADSNQARNASLRVVEALTTHMAVLEPVLKEMGLLKNKEIITIAEENDPKTGDIPGRES